MSYIETPASPRRPSAIVGLERVWGDPAMSLRDWFAGHLAAAELTSAGANKDAAKALANAASRAGQTIEQRIAFNAYSVADAMLAERAKGGGQ